MHVSFSLLIFTKQNIQKTKNKKSQPLILTAAAMAGGGGDGGGSGKRLLIKKFCTGEEVEVSSDDDGFKGAWYVATILKSPPPSSRSKRRPKALVQYHSLLSDSDENKPLVEYVDFSFIRPLPPPHDINTSFQPFDVVDAYHRDGWWKGVVSKVDVFDSINGEGSSVKYTVIFENPPEQFQFSSADLRFHWDWTNGNWVLRPKQKRMEGLRFRKGMAVEVTFDRENLEDAWFPATILEEVGFNSFLVHCGSSKNDVENGHMQETVDSFHIRFPPPSLDVKDFGILEKVDAFVDLSWRDAVVTKILTDGRYSVSLKRTQRDMQLSWTEIRPHLHFMNGTWISFSRNLTISAQFEEQSAHTDSKTKDPEGGISVESSSTTMNGTEEKSSHKMLSIEKDHTEEKSACKKSRKNPSKQSTPSNAKSTSGKVKKPAPNSDYTLSSLAKMLKMENPVKPLSSQACRAKLTPIKKKKQEIQVTDSLLAKCSTNDLVCGLPSAGSGSPFRGKKIDPCQQDAGLENEGMGSLEKKERQLNSQVTMQWVPETDREDKKKGESTEIFFDDAVQIEKDADSSDSLAEGSKGSHAGNSYQHSNEVINQQKKSSIIGQQKEGGQHNVAGAGASKMNFKGCATKAIVSVENDVAEGVNVAAVGESFDDQSLSKYFPGKKKRKVENFVQPSAINVQGATEIVESQESPFLKSSTIWGNIESLEVFQVMPQKPHFSPLAECKAASREGCAMGHMLTFATLVEKTSKLQVDDSREVFDGYLEVLSDLEMLGFDVKAVINRLNELLSIKNRHEHLQDQSKNVCIQITECNHEKTKLEKDIAGTDKKITELEEQRAMKVSMKVQKDSELIALEVDAKVINEDIVNASLDFKSLAAAPW